MVGGLSFVVFSIVEGNVIIFWGITKRYALVISRFSIKKTFQTVLSGSEEAQGKSRLPRTITRLCSRPLIVTSQDYISASLTTVLAATLRIVQLMYTVS